MSISYREVFEKLIGQYLKNSIIYKYSSKKMSHNYTPFRHDVTANTEKILAEYMRKYIYLYAYSEEEVLKAYERGWLNNLETAAQKALRDRLPNRSGAKNGLYSELFLDLLVTMYNDDVNKLATRAIYRQRTDNQEIKGFDGLHILVNNTEKQLWLGQAKMGGESYCIDGIKKDINKIKDMIYTSTELYFIADKEEKTVQAALDLLDKINGLSFNCDEKKMTVDERAESFKKFLIDENIKIIVPCLLAYESDNCYKNHSKIDSNIQSELNKMTIKFDKEFKSLFDEIDCEILIWFIPIRDLESIRSNMGV